MTENTGAIRAIYYFQVILELLLTIDNSYIESEDEQALLGI